MEQGLLCLLVPCYAFYYIEVNVVVSAEFVASVPRLPPDHPIVAGNPGIKGRSSESDIPLDADLVTRSLAQLKSPDIHTRKQGAERLGRIAPDDRVAEVVAALVPQLDDDTIAAARRRLERAHGGQGCNGQHRCSRGPAASVRTKGDRHKFGVTPAQPWLSVSFRQPTSRLA